jgi:hypothetical protein
MMRWVLATAIAAALGAAGAASAGIQGQGPTPDAPVPEFKELDKNKDSYLSEEEVKSSKELSRQMSKLDKNKDTKLDQIEFGAFEGAKRPGKATGVRPRE